jgi:mycothiol synthase
VTSDAAAAGPDRSTPAPLRERVVAPERLPLPDTDGLQWRPASTDDLDVLAELYGAISRADHPNYTQSREEIEDELGHSWVDLESDTLVALAGDGAAVAFGQAMLMPGKETLVRSILFGGVHPELRGRGIGRQLLAWQEARALQQLAAVDLTLPGWIMLYADDRSERTHRLAACGSSATAPSSARPRSRPRTPRSGTIGGASR